MIKSTEDNSTISVRAMRPEDGDSVRRIYQEGIDTGHATFQERAPDWATWDASHLTACRSIAFDGAMIIGWTALSPISARDVYRGVSEVSIYIAAAAQGRGVGTLLMRRLIEESEAAGIWTLQAGIFPENAASIALHLNHGFREIGTRQRVGLMSFGPREGHWRDVRILERRSHIVGSD